MMRYGCARATGRVALLLAFSLIVGSCSRPTIAVTPAPARRGAARSSTPRAVIPAPVSLQLSPPDSFVIDTSAVIVLAPNAPAEAERIARYFASMVGSWAVRGPRRLGAGETPPRRSITLTIDDQKTALGPEGYELTIGRDAVTLVANQPNGLFYGVQTMRQLLPTSVEHTGALDRSLVMPAARIVDSPRFAWRGFMLDVARHFLPAEDVKRFVDLIAFYKLNRLHLHLTDDQGWRIEIKSRPNLAAHGGSMEIGDGTGGFYTQAQFADIVAYAQSRFVTVVPEIEMPGHANAGLSSYPEATCQGASPATNTGISTGTSTMCVDKEATYAFIDDVVREVAALVPTPYFHIGGDEVAGLTTEQYHRFLERAQGIVQKYGKRMIGWGEIAPANLSASTIVHHWKPDSSHLQVARGGKVLLSPATHVYLDMKYDSTTILGLNWAAYVEVKDAYAWEPASLLPGVPESALVGVEAPLWSETVEKLQDYEYMAFPRLAAVAEVGWSPATVRDWDAFRLRLALHGPRLVALGVNFYRSPQIPWRQ